MRRIDVWQITVDVLTEGMSPRQKIAFRIEMAMRPFARRNIVDMVMGDLQAERLAAYDDEGHVVSIVDDITEIIERIRQLIEAIRRLIGRFQ